MDDLQLISAYTYAASYTRIRFLKTLADYIPETDTPTITFSKSYTPLSAEKEKELIEKSTILKPISERNAEIAGFSTKPLINFSLFHDVDLSKPSAKWNSLDQKINKIEVYPVGDSLYTGNPKVGNGLMNHLSHIAQLVRTIENAI